MKNESKKKLGDDLYLIAEIGVNHAGSITKAKEMILACKESGAHAAKFQSYKAEKIAAKDSPSYWDLTEESTTSQFKLFKKYDTFNNQDYIELSRYCNEVGIDFMSTPFDLEAVDFLNDLVNIFKIASADITNYPLLRKVASKNKPIILSTGCSTIEEIQAAVNELNQNGASEIVLLHCILNYPTQNTNANLGMISGLKKQFPDLHIGYSDHTHPCKNMSVLCNSYLLGARVIEKHFTFDKSLPGNDHYHSMDKVDVVNFIDKVKEIDIIIGREEKEPLESEKLSILNARRSLYASKDISEGEVFSNDNIICLRPGMGISPSKIDSILGKKSNIFIKKDTLIDFNMFE